MAWRFRARAWSLVAGVVAGVVAGALAGCGGGQRTAGPPAPSGRPPLDLDPGALYARSLRELPAQIKLRHQVETRFLGRREVVEGYLVLLRPDRFWVRALSPLGATLFDVRTGADGALEVDVRLPQLDRPSAPRYLARDIRRVFLLQCPPDAPPVRAGGFISVRCPLPPGETIPWDGGAGSNGTGDPADDHVVLWIDHAGVLVRKVFERAGHTTAVVDYADYRAVGATWLPHRIDLDHRQIDYGLRIVLLDADPGFDSARLLAPAAMD